MRTKWTMCAATMLLLLASTMLASGTGSRAPAVVKDYQPTGVPTYEGRIEGDTIEDPFVIDDLPFAGSGDTCPFAHDYDEVCPYTGSASPDVVYSYVCQYNNPVIIDLCASQYDTKVFVYENDVHNAGCNSDPPVFDYLEPSEGVIDICGTSGTYHQSGTDWRDTDWYQIDLANESEITFRGVAQFGLRIGIVDGREGCEGVSGFYSYIDVYACEEAELTETLPAGTWWLWVGPVGYAGVMCGEPYTCELMGYATATPVKNISWSTLKALHR